jgi:hypothetical protein
MPEMGDADTADAKAPAIALPAVRWPAPNAALMSAAEVLAWIAFGHVPKADSAIGTIDNDIDTTLRWQHTRLDRTVAAVEAMIAGRWVPATIRGTWPPEAYACHPAWDEQGQEWIESLRLHLGRQDGRDIYRCMIWRSCCRMKLPGNSELACCSTAPSMNCWKPCALET